MTPDKKWSAFWIACGALIAGGELVALVVDGSRDSLSAQVWFVVGLWPAGAAFMAAAFGAGAGVLVLHFFGRRG